MGRAKYEHRGKTSHFTHEQVGSVNYANHFLVWLASLLCYVNSLTGAFVFDDHEAIETNVDIRPSTSVWSVFTNDFWGEPIHGNTSHKSYRPLTVLTFRLNYAIGGLDPIGYHLININLHGLNSVLFLSTCDVIFHGMTSHHSRSLLACFLFVVHPIHTEAVANVVGRADLLCAFFYLFAFRSYVNCFNLRTMSSKTMRPASYSRAWLLVSVLSCILSLLSKEQGVTVLAVCACYDILYICNINYMDCMVFLRHPYVFLKSYNLWPKWLKRLVERITLLMLSCVILLYIRIVVIGGGVPKSFVESDNPIYFNPDLWTRVRTYLYIWCYNVWLLLCPSTLCFDWSMDSIKRIEAWYDYRNVFSLCFVTVSCFVVYKALKLSTCSTTFTSPRQLEEPNGKLLASKDVNRNDIVKGYAHIKTLNLNPQLSPSNQLGRSILQGLLMIVIPFLPASNIFFPVGFVIAERVLYIPSVGYCILVSLGIHAVFEVTTVKLNKDVNNHKANLHNPEANINCTNTENKACGAFNISFSGRLAVYTLLVLLGAKTLYRNSEWQDSGSLATSGIAVNPYNAKMHLCMGNYLAKKGMRSCEEHYREALRLRPNYTLAWVNLGLVLINTGRAEEAEKCYRKALSINPNSANANTNMGNLLRLKRRYGEAELLYKKALSLRPDHPILYYHLGYVQEMLANTKEASKNYLKSIAMMPSNARAYFGFARILIDLLMDNENPDKEAKESLAMAEEYLMMGLRYDKNDIQGRLLFAKVLIKRNEPVLALNELYHVLSHDVNNIEAKYLVGKLMEKDEKLKDVKGVFESILKENRARDRSQKGFGKTRLKG